ncbi:MAG TPA: hypothetical protein VI233_17180 [Puia sp.]
MKKLKKPLVLTLWAMLAVFLLNFIIGTMSGDSLVQILWLPYIIVLYFIPYFILTLVYLQYCKWLAKRFPKMGTVGSRVLYSSLFLLAGLVLVSVRPLVFGADWPGLLSALEYWRMHFSFFIVMVFVNEIMIGRRVYE